MPDENKDQNNEENFLQFTANKAYKDEIDILFETTLKNNLICNLPSNIKHLFNPWMIENDLISLGRSENVKIVQWFVCSGESQSIAEFIETVTQRQFYGNLSAIAPQQKIATGGSIRRKTRFISSEYLRWYANNIAKHTPNLSLAIGFE